jgi:hypothetical protein
MLTNDWENLSVEDLTTAIEDGYSEGKQLEFKRQQDPSNPGHKQTTVGEIVSFANGSGGDLVVGISDDEGSASGLWPVEYDDTDDIILRWTNIIKRNTDPEVPQHLVDVKSIAVTEEQREFVDEECPHTTGHILVFRIERSWRSPHRETMKNNFYERSAGGKSPLDTGAIRRAMFQGELIVERGREFRDDRLAAIAADEVSFPLVKSPKVVMHIVPSNAFSVDGLLRPSAAQARAGFDSEQSVPPLLHPRGYTGELTRYTEDGFLRGQKLGQGQDKFGAYTLTFRSGVIEALTAFSYQDEPTEYILSSHVRNCLEASLPTYIQFLSGEGAAFPYYCFLSVEGAKSIPVATHRTAQQNHDVFRTIDRNVVRLPAVIIESLENPLDSVIDDLLDSLYNASGKAGEMRSQNL